MRRTLSAVQPTNFGDIIALVSLYRPGPMDNIPSFGRRKQGTEPIEYPHPLLEPILAETYGIFVYQEQVMQMSQRLAGYSLGGADLLRRAMGKKKKSELDKQYEVFSTGMRERGLDEPIIEVEQRYPFDEVQRADRLVAVRTPIATGAELAGANAGDALSFDIPEGAEIELHELGRHLRLTGLLAPVQVLGSGRCRAARARGPRATPRSCRRATPSPPSRRPSCGRPSKRASRGGCGGRSARSGRRRTRDRRRTRRSTTSRRWRTT